MAAGTISVTALLNPTAQSEDIQQYVINWTSTGGNIANGVLVDSNGNAIVFKGTQLQAAFKLGTGTTGAATLTNASGVNVWSTVFSTLTAAIQDTPLTPSGIPFILGATT